MAPPQISFTERGSVGNIEAGRDVLCDALRSGELTAWWLFYGFFRVEFRRRSADKRSGH